MLASFSYQVSLQQGGMLFPVSQLLAVLMDAEFAMEDGLTKASDFSTHSQPPHSSC